jgi:CubicO group peptidase (beta-lactamase class C family)
MRKLPHLFIACAFSLGLTIAAHADALAPIDASALEYAAPESVGFAPEKIEALKQGMQAIVDAGDVAGMTTMLARDGKVVQFESFGVSDLATGAATEKDQIFRIFSMTKPVTGVAMMMLYEEGKWTLDDPVSKFIPEFSDLKVADSVDADGNLQTEDLASAITMRQLMSHTAGFSYGFAPQVDPVDKLYVEAKVFERGTSLSDMIAKLAATPLAFQPGTQWRYSVAVDIQGHIIEKLSGKTLGEFFEERIFAPLGMVDTGFYVPEEKRDRFGKVYAKGEDGKLVEAVSDQLSTYLDPPTLPSGGGGLVGTSEDYMRFALMLLNEGEFGGARLLKPETITMMRTNHLPEPIATINFNGEPSEGITFGLDFGIIENPEGPTGSYFWGGAAGTWFWVDPVNDLTFVGMIQRFGFDQQMMARSQALVYDALAKPTN